MKILITHDGSALADVAVPSVQALAGALGVQAEVTALCITSRHADEGTEEAQEAADCLDRIGRALDAVPVMPLVRQGEAGPLIIEVAEALRIDLIVMGTRGSSDSTQFLGSVADYVVRHSRRTPVLLCRPAVAGTVHFHKLLVPLDGSEFSRAALKSAAELGLLTHAGMVLLRVTDSTTTLRTLRTPAGYELEPDLVDDATLDRVLVRELEEARAEMATASAELRADGVHDIVADIQQGLPGEAIARAVTEARCDTVVLATRGRGRGSDARLLGSVADHVLRHVGTANILAVPVQDR